MSWARRSAGARAGRALTRAVPRGSLLHALNEGNSKLYAEDIKGLAEALKGLKRSLVAANHRLLVPPTFLNVNAVVPELIKKGIRPKTTTVFIPTKSPARASIHT